MSKLVSRGLRYVSDRLPAKFLDLADYEHTVFLAGTGRSGTTWIEDVINFDGSHRVMFEPFHSRRTKILREWNYRQYLRPTNREQRYLEPATQILTGKIRSKWVDQFRCKPIVSKRLIKDIRANLILKWIKRNFPAIRIVLLLRHPCAVANSKLKQNWETHLEDFLSQEELMQDFLEPFRAHIENAKDPFERHVFMWCVENYVPLKQFDEGDICIMFYEEICTSPEANTRKLFQFLGRPYSAEIMDCIARPSAVTRSHSAILTGASLIDAWRPEIVGRQLERAIEIMRLFGLDEIYGAASLPRARSRKSQ